MADPLEAMLTKQQPEASALEQQQQQQQQQVDGSVESAAETPQEDAAVHDVEELIPPVARGAASATYGYDIQQMQERPWAQPGANLADYFNYDFDEASYRAFCAMHTGGPRSVKLRAEEYVTKLFAPSAGMGQVSGGAMMEHQHHHHHHHQHAHHLSPYPQVAMGAAPPHRGAMGGVPLGPASGSMAGQRPRLHKTKLCYAYRDGVCTKGDQCNFAHGQAELDAGRQSYRQQMEALGYTGAEAAPFAAHHHHHHQHHHQHHHHHHHHQLQVSMNDASGGMLLQPPHPQPSAEPPGRAPVLQPQVGGIHIGVPPPSYGPRATLLPPSSEGPTAGAGEGSAPAAEQQGPIMAAPPPMQQDEDGVFERAPMPPMR